MIDQRHSIGYTRYILDSLANCSESTPNLIFGYNSFHWYLLSFYNRQQFGQSIIDKHTPFQTQLNQPVVDRIGMCLIPSFERENCSSFFYFKIIYSII